MEEGLIGQTGRFDGRDHSVAGNREEIWSIKRNFSQQHFFFFQEEILGGPTGSDWYPFVKRKKKKIGKRIIRKQ